MTLSKTSVTEDLRLAADFAPATYDDVAIQQPELTLPHPRVFERAFVLVPLAEIVPDRVIAGRRVAEALAGLSTEGIQRLPDLD